MRRIILHAAFFCTMFSALVWPQHPSQAQGFSPRHQNLQYLPDTTLGFFITRTRDTIYFPGAGASYVILNGLTESGDSITLGGPLTEDTQILTDTFNFYIAQIDTSTGSTIYYGLNASVDFAGLGIGALWGPFGVNTATFQVYYQGVTKGEADTLPDLTRLYARPAAGQFYFDRLDEKGFYGQIQDPGSGTAYFSQERWTPQYREFNFYHVYQSKIYQSDDTLKFTVTDTVSPSPDNETVLEMVPGSLAGTVVSPTDTSSVSITLASIGMRTGPNSANAVFLYTDSVTAQSDLYFPARSGRLAIEPALLVVTDSSDFSFGFEYGNYCLIYDLIATGGNTVTLPHPIPPHFELTLYDGAGNSSTRPLTVDVDGAGTTINGGASVALDLDNGALHIQALNGKYYAVENPGP